MPAYTNGMELTTVEIAEASFKPIVTVTQGMFGATALVLAALCLLHTLHLLGNKTILYRSRQPVEGWNRRFYPACILMIIALLVAMWLLNVWSHTQLPV